MKAGTGAEGFTKAAVEISAITHEIQRDSVKGGGNLRPRPVTPWGVLKPGAVPALQGHLEPLELLLFLEKRREPKGNK